MWGFRFKLPLSRKRTGLPELTFRAHLPELVPCPKKIETTLVENRSCPKEMVLSKGRVSRHELVFVGQGRFPTVGAMCPLFECHYFPWEYTA